MLKSVPRILKKTYVGYTNNLDKRIFLHNTNKGAKSTKGYKWIVIYKKKFNSNFIVVLSIIFLIKKFCGIVPLSF